MRPTVNCPSSFVLFSLLLHLGVASSSKGGAGRARKGQYVIAAWDRFRPSRAHFTSRPCACPPPPLPHQKVPWGRLKRLLRCSHSPIPPHCRESTNTAAGTLTHPSCDSFRQRGAALSSLYSSQVRGGGPIQVVRYSTGDEQQHASPAAHTRIFAHHPSVIPLFDESRMT